jgi:hypothetical protein
MLDYVLPLCVKTGKTISIYILIIYILKEGYSSTNLLENGVFNRLRIL